jgi:hypothetical protein
MDCSELILELYGPEVGEHARTAMGVATTPFGVPVIIAAEVERYLQVKKKYEEQKQSDQQREENILKRQDEGV